MTAGTASGPLARMNTASRIDTPLANAARQTTQVGDHGAPNNDPAPITGRG
jgi:hypothetical protein